MNRYKVICEGAEYFVDAGYYDISDGILDLYINDEEVGASFVAGYWKSVMICDESESESWKNGVKSVKAFTNYENLDKVEWSV